MSVCCQLKQHNFSVRVNFVFCGIQCFMSTHRRRVCYTALLKRNVTRINVNKRVCIASNDSQILSSSRWSIAQSCVMCWDETLKLSSNSGENTPRCYKHQNLILAQMSQVTHSHSSDCVYTHCTDEWDDALVCSPSSYVSVNVRP